MIDLRNIRHRFAESDWELVVPRLPVPEGDVLAIIGPNGSGKTTLLRIASGLLRPLEGTVSLYSMDIARMSRRAIAQDLGYLPQELSSEYDLRVEELAAMGRYPHIGGWGRLSSADRRAVDRSLELTGMAGLRGRRLSQLSGGERKRAFLASVLAQQPQFLLLDEPTAALDLPHQIRFFRLLHVLAQEGMGVAVVTHDVNLASLYSDRLMLLSAGESLALGSPHEVLTERTVSAVYGPDVFLCQHRECGRPILIARTEGEKST
jgi:iron complex transport system ATP-binding protein